MTPLPSAISLDELAELERKHTSDAAQKLLTEIWRLRLLEVRANDFVYSLAAQNIDNLPPPLNLQLETLRAELGYSGNSASVRAGAKRGVGGVWSSHRNPATPAQRDKEHQVGRALTPMEWTETGRPARKN